MVSRTQNDQIKSQIRSTIHDIVVTQYHLITLEYYYLNSELFPTHYTVVIPKKMKLGNGNTSSSFYYVVNCSKGKYGNSDLVPSNTTSVNMFTINRVTYDVVTAPSVPSFAKQLRNERHCINKLMPLVIPCTCTIYTIHTQRCMTGSTTSSH